MTDSIDLFYLDKNNIIIHIRYNDKEHTQTYNIKWDNIRTITVNQNELIIFHDGKISQFPIHLDDLIEKKD